MIIGARNYKHDYLVHNDKIVYKDQDGISDQISYGFKTIFAYMYEHFQKKQISETSMEKALELNLIIAEFSYALLPKYFRSILGVTGTLEDMSEFKKSQLKNEYDVKKKYIIPSVYGRVDERR